MRCPGLRRYVGEFAHIYLIKALPVRSAAHASSIRSQVAVGAACSFPEGQGYSRFASPEGTRRPRESTTEAPAVFV